MFKWTYYVQDTLAFPLQLDAVAAVLDLKHPFSRRGGVARLLKEQDGDRTDVRGRAPETT